MVQFKFEKQATGEIPTARGLTPSLGLPFDEMEVNSKLSIPTSEAPLNAIRAELLRYQRKEENQDKVFVTRVEQLDGAEHFSIWRRADVPKAQRPTRTRKSKESDAKSPQTDAVKAKGGGKK